MEIREIQAIIEAVLFAAGDPVEIERLADIVDVDRRSLREILKKMMDNYNYERRGIQTNVLSGVDDYQKTLSMPDLYSYVMMPSSSSISEAIQKIDEITGSN